MGGGAFSKRPYWSGVTNSASEAEFAAWLRNELVANYGMESESWATEQVRRVIWKLNKARRKKPRFEVEILGMSTPTAFTAPGNCIYISRRLLERLPNDDALAMVLSHEAAHHDLGHLDRFAGWARRIPRWRGSWLLATLLRALERKICSHQNELAADERGLELCLKAKFDGSQCLSLFDVLKQNALDVGDVDAVYGQEDDDELDLAENPLDWLFLKSRSLLLKRPSGSHPPLEDRKRNLKARLPSPTRSATAS